jgi:hypothetical protein
MQHVPELRDSCSPKEIAEQVHESYEGWIRQLFQPDAAVFIKECCDALLSTVNRLELGPVSICKPDMEILSEVQFGGAITEDWIHKEFASGLWLIGKTNGSPEISFQRFEHHTILTIGILAVCGAVLFDGAIWQSHLRAALSPHRQTMPTSIFRWETGGANPVVTRAWGEDKKLPLNAELIAYLRKEYFLNQLTELPVLNQKTELQESIERALYWFADAHGDRNTTMRFIKLWSCAECFFAITDKDVTEANARGMATILTFAGYGGRGLSQAETEIERALRFALTGRTSCGVQRCSTHRSSRFVPVDCMGHHLNDRFIATRLSDSEGNQGAGGPSGYDDESELSENTLQLDTAEE